MKALPSPYKLRNKIIIKGKRPKDHTVAVGTNIFIAVGTNIYISCKYYHVSSGRYYSAGPDHFSDFAGIRQNRSLFKLFLEKYRTNRPILPAACKIGNVELW